MTAAPLDRFSFPNGFVRRTEPARGSIDEVRFFDTLVRNVNSRGARRIPAGCNLFVRGWAFNPAPSRPARSVLVTVDGRLTIDAASGRARPDIALSFGMPELGTCGFQAMYPLGELAAGQHIAKIVTLDETNGYYEIPTAETFEIVPSRELFPGVGQTADDRMKISVDGFTALGSGAIPSGGTLLVEHGDVVYVRGWAIDTEKESPPLGIFAIVDGDDYVMGVHGLPREDVARTVRLPEVVRCGFTIRIGTQGLRLGSHALRVAALAEDDSYGVTAVGTIEIA